MNNFSSKMNIVRKYAQLMVGIIFTFYFLYTYSNAIEINDSVANAVLLIVVIYIQTMGEFLYFYNKHGKPRLQDWLRLMIFMTLVLNFMSIVNAANGISTVKFVMGSLSLDDSYFAMFVIIGALAAMDIAYMLGRLFRRQNGNNEAFSVMRKNAVFMILLLSTVFKSYLLFVGFAGFGVNVNDASGLVSLLNMLSQYLNPFALVVSAYIIFVEKSTSKSYKILFYALVGWQIVLGLLSGMKENAVEPILYALIVYLLSGRRLPKSVIVSGLFSIVLLYPINTAYRQVIGNPYLNSGSNMANWMIAINKVATEPLSETFSTGVENYADRGAMFPFLLFAIQIEPKWDYYKDMNRYLTMPLAFFVPRALWEDKPKGDIGGVLYELITGARTMTSVTPTNIGWAYLEGGAHYVFLIFLIIGLLMEYVDKKNIFKPLVLLFYAVLLHKAIKPEWDPYFMIVSLVPMLIIYWVLLKIVGMRRVQS
ncbi:MAG: hypothetical protein IE887_04605 [Campylobacterales bacterium]|nr:hypothetical protein [Campylobacterales bacterium]